jgi:hypothetical protein
MLDPYRVTDTFTIIPDEEGKMDDRDIGRDSQTKAAFGKPTLDMKIPVNRISFDDHFHHLHNWRTVILPRLRQWADGVYRIRQSDELRYRLLTYMVKMQSLHDVVESHKRHTQMAWKLAFEQCPFLRDGFSYGCYRRE